MLQGSLPKFSNQDNPAAFHPCRHVRFLTFCYLAAFNFWLLLCPATLSHDWQMGSVPLVTSLADIRNVATCFFFVCCLLVLYRGLLDFEFQRHPPLVLGALLLALPFLPAANLVVTVGFVVAERVLYIPSLGSMLLAAYGAQLLWGALLRQRALLLAAGLTLFLLFCSRTLARNRDWLSREALIRAGLKALPHNAKMHYNFGNFLRDEGNLDLAAQHYKEALRLWPTYASAHNNLGTLMSATEEAESHFLSAIRYSPNHVNAHYNLGQVYRKVNRSDEAERMLERCIRLDTAYTPAYLLLTKLYSGRGLQAEVGRLLRHVTRLQPTSADHLAEYADWLHNSGRSSEALIYYQRALSVSATHKQSLLGAAKILRAKGQWARIHQLMIRSLVMSRDHRGGIVYTGDLYIRSWKPESGYHHHSEAEEPMGSQNVCLFTKKSCIPTGSHSESLHSANNTPGRGRKSPRRKPRPWRRPAINRTSVVRRGADVEKSCSLKMEYGSSRVMTINEDVRSSGTAAFNQGYHSGYWSQQQVPPVGATDPLHIEVSPVPLPIGDREVLCLGNYPEPNTEEDFAPEFMTG